MTEPMRIVTGYIHGRSFRMTVVKRQGLWVESGTARAFDRMFMAAQDNGLDMKLVSGWRSMNEQQVIWDTRQDPKVRAAKGVAATPGFSNHQSGRALDIQVRDLRLGVVLPVFEWLNTHAHEYGFARTVSAEPWHWELTALPEDRRVA